MDEAMSFVVTDRAGPEEMGLDRWRIMRDTVVRRVSPTARLGNPSMPYVNIKITPEGATPEAKAELIAGVTELLQRVLGKNLATTVVVIDEVPLDSWGIGGLPITDYRQRQAGR